MAKRRLSPKERQADLDAYAALLATSDYNPSNKNYSTTNATAAFEKMNASRTTAVQSKAKADGDNDTANDDEWTFHEFFQNVDAQFAAQYGKNSNEFQSLGLKKKSEYKRSVKKKPATP